MFINALQVVLLLLDVFICAAESALLTDSPPFFAYYHCCSAVVRVGHISGNTIIPLGNYVWRNSPRNSSTVTCMYARVCNTEMGESIALLHRAVATLFASKVILI